MNELELELFDYTVILDGNQYDVDDRNGDLVIFKNGILQVGVDEMQAFSDIRNHKDYFYHKTIGVNPNLVGFTFNFVDYDNVDYTGTVTVDGLKLSGGHVVPFENCEMIKIKNTNVSGYQLSYTH